MTGGDATELGTDRDAAEVVDKVMASTGVVSLPPIQAVHCIHVTHYACSVCNAWPEWYS